jgi:hypothetical protein
MGFKPLFLGSERLELIYKKRGKKGAGEGNISGINRKSQEKEVGNEEIKLDHRVSFSFYSHALRRGLCEANCGIAIPALRTLFGHGDGYEARFGIGPGRD